MNIVPGSADAGLVALHFEGADRGDGHAGMGILVTSRLIVTCSHVVNIALGRGLLEQKAPDKDRHLRVVLPFPEPIRASAKVLAWEPPGPIGNDLALLELPEECDTRATGTAILMQTSGMWPLDWWGSVTRVSGNGDAGFACRVRMGVNVGKWQSIETDPGPLQPGFSGAGVHDPQRLGTIGIVVASSNDPQVNRSYLIPTSTIRKSFPTVPVEPAPPPADAIQLWRLATWLGFAVAFLTTTEMSSDAWPILHFWTKGTGTLAALFGAHLLLNLLLPLSFWLQVQYARRFRLRSWFQRVPPIFGNLSGLSNPAGRVTAGVTLLFLNLAPLYVATTALLHLLDEQRKIVVYRSDLDDAGLRDDSFDCSIEDQKMCWRDDLSLWRPLPGYEYGWNSYHILADEGPKEHWAKANVWPVVTPILLIGGFLAALVGWGAVLFMTFRRSRG